MKRYVKGEGELPKVSMEKNLPSSISMSSFVFIII